MAGVTADSVIVSIEGRFQQYERDFDNLVRKTESGMAKLRRLTEKPVTIGATSGRNAEREAADAERQSARKINASRKEAETEEQKSLRISAAVDRGIAARERDARSAEQAADRIVKAGSKAAVARQSRLMSGTSLGAVSSAPVEDKVNYLLRDQIDLRTKLGAAIAGGESAAVTALNDQIALLRLIEQYKRAGLSDTQAAERAESGLSAIVKSRAVAEENAARRGVAGTGRVANGYRNLGRQIADVGVGVAGGMSPFLIIAQQAPQVADALVDTGGKAAKVAAFFAGPWGAALLAAGSVLGVLGSKMFETGDTVESLTKKLEEDAKKSEMSRRAHDAYAQTLDGVIEAIAELNKSLDEQNNGYRSSAENAQIAAEKALSTAKAKRAEAAATLELAEAELRANLARSRSGNERSDLAASGLGRDLSDIQAARARLGNADQAISNAERAIAVAKGLQASQYNLLTSEQKINREYDKRVSAKIKELAARKANEKQINAEVGAIEKERAARLKTQADLEKASSGRSRSAIGRDATIADATAVIKSLGGRVTSGYRSTQDQARIYADKIAGRHQGPVARPGTSDHERGQAIDVAYGPGISVASISKAFRDAGIRIRQILPEPQQRVFHVAFGKAGKSAEAIARGTKAAEEKISRKDDQYDKTVADLNASILSAKGKQAEGIEAQYQAAVDNAKAAEAERAESYKALLNREAEAGIDGKVIEQRRATLDALSKQLTAQQILTAATERQAALAEDSIQRQINSATSNADLLRDRASVERSRKRRDELQKQAFDAQYQAEELSIKNRINKAAPGSAEEASAEADLRSLPERDAIRRQQYADQNKGQYQRYRESLTGVDSLSEDIDNIKVEVLDRVADSLATATTNALGLTGALGDVVGQIIKIGIQRRLIGPLADGLFGKADGSTVGTIGNILTSIFGGARASGGDVSAGKLYRINENGPEYFQPAMSGKIIPTGRAAGGSGGMTVVQNISVDGRNSVTPEGFASQILSKANSFAAKAAADAGKSSYEASPARYNKFQQLGS